MSVLLCIKRARHSRVKQQLTRNTLSTLPLFVLLLYGFRFQAAGEATRYIAGNMLRGSGSRSITCSRTNVRQGSNGKS